jgi:hypothetical protein
VLALAGLAALAVVAGCGHSTSSTRPQGAGFGTVTLRMTDAPAAFDHIFLDVQEVWVHRLNDGTAGDTLCRRDDPEDHGDDLKIATSRMRRSSIQDGGDGEGDGGGGDGHGGGGHGGGGHGGGGGGDGDHNPADSLGNCADREDDDNGAWHRLDATPGVYDLLDLKNGVFKTLAVGDVPAGTYDQVRLKLGSNNTIVVDGVTHPLKVPSGQESGYKLFGRFEVPVGGTVDIGIDFDAARSVHETGNGMWILRPVARIIPVQTSGGIHGTVSPASATSWVYAMMGADTVTSTMTAGDGSFTLSLLAAGDYAVHIVPTVTGFRDTTLSPVHVTAGQTTELGTIDLTGTPPPPGRLVGVVMPDSFVTQAFLLQSGTRKDSTATGSGGHFAFENLVAGTYDLHLVPQHAGFRDTTLAGLAVHSGATTDVGTVALDTTGAALRSASTARLFRLRRR